MQATEYAEQHSYTCAIWASQMRDPLLRKRIDVLLERASSNLMFAAVVDAPAGDRISNDTSCPAPSANHIPLSENTLLERGVSSL
jgi:hypothetical protein